MLGLILVFWGLRPEPAEGEPPALARRIAAVVGAAGLAMGPILHLVVARDAYVWGAVGNGGLLLLWGLGLADVHRVATGSSAEQVDSALERAGPTSY